MTKETPLNDSSVGTTESAKSSESQVNTRQVEGGENNKQESDNPDVGNLDPTDGRKKYDWKSGYHEVAQVQIRRQAWYIFILLFVALFLIFATWMGYFVQMFPLSAEDAATFRKYCYYSFSGLLGGTVFGMKYLYRVVARGYWHQDRNVWRYQSPFIALAVSFAIGTLVDGKVMSMGTQANGAAIVGLGFLIGYFADDATGKLHEIAGVLFGKSSVKSNEPPSSHHK